MLKHSLLAVTQTSLRRFSHLEAPTEDNKELSISVNQGRFTILRLMGNFGNYDAVIKICT